MKNALLTAIAICLFVSCKKEINATQNTTAVNTQLSSNAVGAITAVEATYWDSVFTRYGNGWTGGDAAMSYKLPDGRSMWMWGDSFLDTVYPDRHRPVIGFIHNQITTINLQGGDFRTYYGGTKQNPQPYFQAGGSKYYWPCFAFMNSTNTKVYVFLDKIKATGEGGSFGFKVVGVDMATLNYPDLSIASIVPFSTGDHINWAGDAYESADGYVYLFGTESTQYNKFIHVARTSKTDPVGDVKHWDGSTWVTDAAASVRVQGGVSEGFSFFQYKGKQYLLSQENLLGPNINIWDAASPVGPFTRKRLVYTTPQKVGTYDVWTYNAKAHLEFNNANQLLVGYCTNSINSLGLYRNADTYRPYFVWASNWQ
ncbi:hypothetical protein BH11BAC6_BH11BAC6_13180 [soil metagenome]